MLNLFNAHRSKNLLSRYRKTAQEVTAFEATVKKLTKVQIRLRLSQLRNTCSSTGSNILPEVFALVREAASRTLGLRAYDVQLMGAMALHEGILAEMRTGEGKTLVIVFAAVLNSLFNKGVHIVTVNEYLAQRDANEMGPVYDFLGLSVGTTLSDMSPEEKQQAYACSVTYGVNHEFGFDYLRDNMILKPGKSQRDLFFAIVDEVDSILIDEARTPLIISGEGPKDVEACKLAQDLIMRMDDSCWIVDEKLRQAHFTEDGYIRMEQLLHADGTLSSMDHLYDENHMGLMQALQAALQVNTLYYRDRHYVVEAGDLIIVDDNTGRKMEGRRWSDGLHQAAEAKEGLEIKAETMTLGSVTYQNYFRKYSKLAGLTGTAMTEAEEFEQIYGLMVLAVPTHRPMVRVDEHDSIFVTRKEKMEALLAQVVERHATGQPLLLGTTSIESSEDLANRLSVLGLTFEVLNAKNHAREADIIAQAGEPHAITVATNMAGRGTDILLGGNLAKRLREKGLSEEDPAYAQEKEAWQKRHDFVLSQGGLCVIGVERNESRRVDDQLRGRAGRQGDPGVSHFFLSFEDELLRIYGEGRLKRIAQMGGMKAGEALQGGPITKAIAKAQKQRENQNYEYRKSLLRFDSVITEQRDAYYAWRDSFVDDFGSEAALQEHVKPFFEDAVREASNLAYPFDSMCENWEPAVLDAVLQEFGVTDWVRPDEDEQDLDDWRGKMVESGFEQMMQRLKDVDPGFAFSLILQVLDHHWQVHLTALANLQGGIHLRSFAQKDPQYEFAKDAFEQFGLMRQAMGPSVLRALLQVDSFHSAPAPKVDFSPGAIRYHPFRDNSPYRNSLCACGSGQRYKHCHGSLTLITADAQGL